MEILQQNLSAALELNDPQAIKDLISKCLDVVRVEMSNPPLVTLPPVTPATLDAETGLPGRLQFERTVGDSIAEGRDFVTALFVSERLPLINKRFGRAAGDRVLLYVASIFLRNYRTQTSYPGGAVRHFRASSTPKTRKRWKVRFGPSNKPLSANIDVGNRSVMLTISCACIMEQISAKTSPEALFSRMDDFVAARSGS